LGSFSADIGDGLESTMPLVTGEVLRAALLLEVIFSCHDKIQMYPPHRILWCSQVLQRGRCLSHGLDDFEQV
jgi:hypothetical protein